jgi:hypothetical protein
MFIEWKTTGSQNNFWIIIQKEDDDLDDHLRDMTAETETGHPGLNSWWNMMMMMMTNTFRNYDESKAAFIFHDYKTKSAPSRILFFQNCKRCLFKHVNKFLSCDCPLCYLIISTGVRLLLRIREVPGSNLGPCDRLSWLRFSWFSLVPAKEFRYSTLALGHYGFLPNPFKLIIIHLTRYTV